MDENLQQFPKKDMFNPWTFWALFSLFLFCSWVLAMAVFPETHCDLYYVLMFPIIIAIALTLLSWSSCCSDDYWIKVPKTRLEGSKYLTLLNGKLCPATPGRWSREEMSELFFLYDGMAMEISFLDERGVRHELNFRVHFSAANPATEDFAKFYQWYYELHVKMPNADAVFEHMKGGNAQPMIFRIEFPINPTIPAINA